MAHKHSETEPTIILVVDDELLIRMEAVAAFEDEGFEVLEAEHAVGALSHLHTRAHDVVALFTDIQMPGELDGVALVHEARRCWPWIHLLVASGHVSPAADTLPSRARFLSKPYRSAEAIRHVREMIAEGHPA
jgi:CheY-like chemotaxis protein